GRGRRTGPYCWSIGVEAFHGKYFDQQTRTAPWARRPSRRVPALQSDEAACAHHRAWRREGETRQRRKSGSLRRQGRWGRSADHLEEVQQSKGLRAINPVRFALTRWTRRV